MVYFELYSIRKIRHIFKKKTAVGLIRHFLVVLRYILPFLPYRPKSTPC